MSSIDHIPTQSLRHLYVADHKTEASAAAKLKKAELKKEIQNAITATSVKVLLEMLTVEQLQAAAEPLGLETKDKKPVRSRNILTKRLTEAILADGLATYLDQMDVEVLKEFAERIGIEPSSKATKGQIIEEIVEEIETTGVRLYFESFSEDLLRDIAYDMKLQKDPLALPGKAVLIEAIVTNTDLPKKEKKKTSQPKVSKHKPALEKGVEYHDVFQHYYLEELVEYAKKNGLKVSGTKKDLINRIIAWLEGDKENTLAGTKRAPRRRKRSASKKKPTPAKKASDSESEPAPAEEEAEEGLDLDNLKKYSIAELKKYCTEEQLTVKGNKKQDYIEAIENYNRED